MRVEEVRSWVVAAMPRLGDSFDELTELDAIAGDGDLGVTVRSGAVEVERALTDLPADVGAAELLRTAGAAFARGNPSSFAALVGAGLLAASRTDLPDDDLTRLHVARAMRAAAETIATRGRSRQGQRTVLDSIVPSVEALESSDSGGSLDALVRAIAAAAAGVEATRSMQPEKGRALWTGRRGDGHPDAGATAYLRFLEALAATAPAAATGADG